MLRTVERTECSKISKTVLERFDQKRENFLFIISGIPIIITLHPKFNLQIQLKKNFFPQNKPVASA